MSAKDFNEKQMETYIERLMHKDLKSKYAKILEEKYQVRRKSKSGRLRYLVPVTVAASFILLFIAFQIFNHTPSNSELAMSYIRETQIMGNPSVMRKDDHMVEKLQMDANTAFVNKKYTEAANLFRQLEITGKADDTDLFYFGVSLLKNKKPDAVRALNMFAKIKDTAQFSKEIKWFTALALLYQNKAEEAKPLLQSIISENGYMAEEAVTLIGSVKE
jgi:hypothetical protein